MLVEQTESTLLGLVALASQVLQGLLAGHHLLAANNAAVLVLDEVGLGETTGSVLGSTMENLGLGTNRNLGHLILRVAILTRAGQPKGEWCRGGRDNSPTMTAIPLAVSVTGRGRRIVLRETYRLYKLRPTPLCPDDRGSLTWIFPHAILPAFTTIKSAGPHSVPMTEALTLHQRIHWSWIIFHTTYLGEYREVEEHRWGDDGDGQGKEIIYERLY